MSSDRSLRNHSCASPPTASSALLASLLPSPREVEPPTDQPEPEPVPVHSTESIQQTLLDILRVFAPPPPTPLDSPTYKAFDM
jgi:hypothetical protein